MPFKIGCPKCKRVYTLADDLRGKAIRCKDCEHAFRIPASSPQPAANGTRQPVAARQPSAVASQPAAGQPQTSRRPARPAPAKPAPTLNVAARVGEPLRSDNDVFAGAVPGPQDPLANHVIQNPGFAYVDPAKYAPQSQLEPDRNSIYFNPAAAELAAKVEQERQIHRELTKQNWWPVWVALAGLVVTLLPALLMLLVFPPLAILFLIGAIVVLGIAGTVAEIWTLTLMHRYDPDHFGVAIFIAWYRYAFLSQNWDRHKDVGTLLLISILGGFVIGGLFFVSIMIAGI